MLCETEVRNQTKSCFFKGLLLFVILQKVDDNAENVRNEIKCKSYNYPMRSQLSVSALGLGDWETMGTKWYPLPQLLREVM